jgi:hypothetical protein
MVSDMGHLRRAGFWSLQNLAAEFKPYSQAIQHGTNAGLNSDCGSDSITEDIDKETIKMQTDLSIT